MRIFLTGSTGFIGSHLLTMLLNLSYEVLAPIRNSKISKNEIHKNLRLIIEENNEITKNYLKNLEKVDCLIHCAGRTHVMKETEKNSLNIYRKTNLKKTCVLAEAAASKGVKRFIFLS